MKKIVDELETLLSEAIKEINQNQYKLSIINLRIKKLKIELGA